MKTKTKTKSRFIEVNGLFEGHKILIEKSQIKKVIQETNTCVILQKDKTTTRTSTSYADIKSQLDA